MTNNDGKFYYIGSIITAIMAMFTKEMTVTLPLMILLYEFCFFKIKKSLNWSSYRTLVVTRKHLIPFLLTIFIIPLTIMLLPSQKGSRDAWCHYGAQCYFPYTLSFDSIQGHGHLYKVSFFASKSEPGL